MDELEIAESLARVLNGLACSGESEVSGDGYSSEDRPRHSAKLGGEEMELARLSAATAQLAMSRAKAAARSFEDVFRETEMAVSVRLARILAGTIDPVLEALRKVAVEEEGHVCGVCQEEMEGGDDVRAMACTHAFHAYCIVKWLKQSNACPLCRLSVRDLLAGDEK